jgi:hypothetical protein
MRHAAYAFQRAALGMLVMVHQAWRAEEDVVVAWHSGPVSTPPAFTAVMAR